MKPEKTRRTYHTTGYCYHLDRDIASREQYQLPWSLHRVRVCYKNLASTGNGMRFTDWLDELSTEHYAAVVFGVALVSVLVLEFAGSTYVGRDPDPVTALVTGVLFGIIFGGGYYALHR